MKTTTDHIKDAIMNLTPADLAYAFLLRYASRRHGRRFIAEDVLKNAEEWGALTPASKASWGGVFKRAARSGAIKHDGVAISPTHRRPVTAWRAV